MIAVLGENWSGWFRNAVRCPPFKGFTDRTEAAFGTHAGLDCFAVQSHQYGILCSGQVTGGKRWVHLSISCQNRAPGWREMIKIRDMILGEEAQCIQIAPPASQYVNDHPHVMHLWYCVDGDGIPDFRHFDPRIGKLSI